MNAGIKDASKKVLLGDIASSMGMGLLALTFALAAFAKINAFNELTTSIQVSRLVPQVVTFPLAVIVVGAEILIVPGLLLKKTRVPALWAYASMMFLFMGYAFWRLTKGITAPCSCFGLLYKMSPEQSLLLCGGLLCLAVTLLNRSSSLVAEAASPFLPQRSSA